MADYSEAREKMNSLGLLPSWSNRTMVAEALSRGVEIERSLGGRQIKFSHDGTEHSWRNGTTTLNSQLAKTIGRFKDLQSRIFLNHGIQAPENATFSPDEAERAWRWAEPLGRLVVKPKNGTHGNSVHVGIDTRSAFGKAFEQVASNRGHVLVEQFHVGVEHRCLVVDGKLVAATRRRPASVKGDGVSTIDELVAKKNSYRGKIHKRIQLGEEERQHLARRGASFESVPEKSDRIHLLGTSNIHTGGDAIDATHRIRRHEKAIIEKAVSVISGMRLVGLDVLLPRRPGDSELTIIEINPAPMISMHHFPWVGKPRNVSGAIMEAMFPEATP